MARFRAEDADKYGGQGGGGFFSLRDDGDIATVRFMYNSMQDVEGDSVHEIKLTDGKKRYVNCLREYKDPVSVCPLCASGNPVKAKLFIPVYEEGSEVAKTWERGKKFFGKMSSLCTRYSNAETPLVSHTFEIERRGAAGDQSTTYEIYETGVDNTTLEDLPEKPDLSGFLLDKTADEMEYFLQEGQFPPTGDEDDERPVRRRGNSNNQNSGRRTPARRGEAF